MCEVHTNWKNRIIEQNFEPVRILHEDCKYLVRNTHMKKMRILCNERVLYEHLECVTNTGLEDLVYTFKPHIMASRIKRAFRRAISVPSYKMCRDRLKREFEKMF